jgi:hypothetical protein
MRRPDKRDWKLSSERVPPAALPFAPTTRIDEAEASSSSKHQTSPQTIANALIIFSAKERYLTADRPMSDGHDPTQRSVS